MRRQAESKRAASAAGIAIIAATMALAFANDVAAQAYPSRAIRIVVGFPAGGPTDVVSRLVGQKLSERLGQSVVIDNRPGAGGVLATEMVAKGPADGYTLLMGTIGGLTVSQHLLRKMPYDTLRDLAPITQAVANTNFMVLHPSVPVKTVKEFIALARAQPDALSYASSGNGTITHLSGELFKMLTGVRIVHVPYKGGAPALTALISGEVALSFENALVALPHIRAGKMRPIAVTGAKRTQALPQVPTMQEAGLAGYQATGWYGLLAPAATPKEIVERLHAEASQVLRMKEVEDKLAAMGSDAIGNTPAEFARFIRSESEKWGKVVKAAGMKPD
jgi:tripartite-type tricarboxylate transporter receptor subunit TctC